MRLSLACAALLVRSGDSWRVSAICSLGVFAMSSLIALQVPFVCASRVKLAGGGKNAIGDSVGPRVRHRGWFLCSTGTDASNFSLDKAIETTRAATVVVAPHAKTRVPFLSGTRRGSGVVVSLDGVGGEFRILTCAHVACLAGPNNELDIKASPAMNAQTRLGYVVAVHPTLDLALIALKGEEDGSSSEKNQNRDVKHSQKSFPSSYAPLAEGAPTKNQKVTALGYSMGWSSVVQKFKGLKGDDGAIEGVTLATYEGTERNTSENENKKTTSFILHTAVVASGASGGPLVDDTGHVIGVHSFGDAFYGGAMDVAVATPKMVIETLARRDRKVATEKVNPTKYKTSKINAMIFKSSDPALESMCPDLTQTQRKNWIL